MKQIILILIGTAAYLLSGCSATTGRSKFIGPMGLTDNSMASGMHSENRKSRKANLILKVENKRYHQGQSNKNKNAPPFIYETDGHYWTVLVVATMLKIPEAQAIAYAAEYPDNVMNKDGYIIRKRITFMYPRAQIKVHALTGGNPDDEKEISRGMFKSAQSANEIGTASHRLGDSYAHINDKKRKMYPHIIAHLFHWKRPDKIKTNPNKYLSYVADLVECLGGKDSQIDMSVFNYITEAGLNSKENEAILKAEYNILRQSIAFTIDQGQVTLVKSYLEKRLKGSNVAYVLYSNSYAKGRTATSFINVTYAMSKALLEAKDSIIEATIH